MPETLDKESLKALSTETRQDIVKLLSKRPYTASEISKKLNKHVTTVTEHLTVLEKSGLVKRKDSSNKWVYYTLSDKGGKLFKPLYYSWVIVLSISAIFIVAGFVNIFIVVPGTMEEKAMTSTLNAETARGAAEPMPDMTGPILIIIGIIMAIIGAYFYYKIRKNKK